jgi:hypothetical protein
MFSSRLALQAAWLLLLGTASAVPAPEPAAVDTATSVSTTITGTSTHATDGELSPSTGAAKPVPTNDKGTDAFVACHNTDGEFKPFCLPKHTDVYYPDSMHYSTSSTSPRSPLLLDPILTNQPSPTVTWDPSFFPGANTTLKLLGFYTNTSTPTPKPGPPTGEEEAFSSENIDAGWGFYQWRLSGSLISNTPHELVNITLHMVALPKGGSAAQWLTGPTITLRWKPKPPPAPKPPKNDDQALYIALPIVFGGAALIIVGTYFCNRQIRRIEVGSIASRRALSRKIKGGVGASRKDRARNKDKEQGIRLMDRDGAGMESDEERGDSWEEGWRSQESEGAGRRVFERVDRKRM